MGGEELSKAKAKKSSTKAVGLEFALRALEENNQQALPALGPQDRSCHWCWCGGRGAAGDEQEDRRTLFVEHLECRSMDFNGRSGW